MIWKGLTKKDASWLVDWTNARLDEAVAREDAIIERFAQHVERARTDRSEQDKFERALEYAGWGDMSLLEIDFPDIAKQFPKPGKRGRPRNDKVWHAADDVRSIRRLWREHKQVLQDHLKGRVGTVTVTAEEIAADRHGVEIEAVCARLHHHRSRASA